MISRGLVGWLVGGGVGYWLLDGMGLDNFFYIFYCNDLYISML